MPHEWSWQGIARIGGSITPIGAPVTCPCPGPEHHYDQGGDDDATPDDDPGAADGRPAS